MSIRDRFTIRLAQEHREIIRLLVACVLVGVVAGVGAIAFYYLLRLISFGCLTLLAHYHPPGGTYEDTLFAIPAGSLPAIRRWLLFLLPVAGGLISGLFVFSLAPEAEGHGTDAAIEAYHFKGGEVRARVPLVKMIASALTIGSGGSGGREGPIAQIGSGFGSALARVMGLPVNQRRMLMAAGMGAGIGAIFHAPLAGAIFAAEVMYRELDLEHEILVPSFIASIVAYAVFGSVFGFHPLFITPDYTFHHPKVLLAYLLLTIICAGGAALYVTAFYSVRKMVLTNLKVPNHIKPAIGGLAVGAIGVLLPEALGTGYGIVQAVFSAEGTSAVGNFDELVSWSGFAAFFPDGTSLTTIAMLLLVVVALAKIATTALTIGSGGSGGVFGPAVVIGGALGGATGIFCQKFFPMLDVQPGAFALVGMAGFFAGAANTPISTIIMVSEMTGNYNLLVPSMLVCILCYSLCQRFNLYHMQLPSHFEAPSQTSNMATVVLRSLTVGQALAKKLNKPPIVVPRDADFREVLVRFTRSTQGCLPVVDTEGRLSGAIDTSDIRQAIGQPGVDSLLIAEDLASPATTVTRRDSLLTAMNRMIAIQTNELVVVDAQDPGKIIGTISRSDIIAAYDRHLIRGLK